MGNSEKDKTNIRTIDIEDEIDKMILRQVQELTSYTKDLFSEKNIIPTPNKILALIQNQFMFKIIDEVEDKYDKAYQDFALEKAINMKKELFENLSEIIDKQRKVDGLSSGL